MIRRRVGEEVWLITQNDHAALAGELAKYWGNDRFAKLDPASPTVTGIAMHDCGWPIHDDAPTLNELGLPLDVFETPPAVGLTVWWEAADRAAAIDPYAGLLTSLHSLSLSIFASTSSGFGDHRNEYTDPRNAFELNKFQHRQIELQETLRKQLGLRTDRPLRHGLAELSKEPAERNLTHNFHVLQALDKVSLCLCCTEPPFKSIEPLEYSAGGEKVSLAISRPWPEKTYIDPWPFDRKSIDVSVPFKRLPRSPYFSLDRFRSAYRDAKRETIPFSLSPP